MASADVPAVPLVSAVPAIKAVSADSPFVIRIDLAAPVLKVYRHHTLYRAYRVALGKRETQTPIGRWRIVNKHRGWGGGFGTRWLGIDVTWGTYGIHGTNRPSSIGHYASNGCIRMLNTDVESLYDTVPLGTPVIVTGNPLLHLRKLEYGKIGADVQAVQRRLQQLGYYRGLCNGRFESGTQFAWVYYELAHGLPMDGVVDIRDYRTLGLVP